MTRLRDLAKLIRTKNAGPFQLTLDVMFDDERTYRHVVAARVITPESMAVFFGLAPERVRVFEVAAARAIKVTVPRAVPCGDPDDSDLFGGQQFGPLIDLPVPELPAR